MSLRGSGSGAATGEKGVSVPAGGKAGGLHSLFSAQRKRATEAGGAEPVRSALVERVQAEVGGQDVVRELSRSAYGAGCGGEGGVLPRKMSGVSWGRVCGEAPSRQTGLREVPHADAAEQGCGAHGGNGPPHHALSEYAAGTAIGGARDAGRAAGAISEE